MRFTSVSCSSATIQVDIDVTGASPEDLTRIVPDGFKGPPGILVELVGPSGQVVGVGAGSGPLFAQIFMPRGASRE